MSDSRGFKKYPLVLIHWYDHAGDGGWVETKDLEEPPITAKTVGWLVKEDDLRYHIMDTLTDDQGKGGHSEILKGTVIKAKVLRKSF